MSNREVEQSRSDLFLLRLWIDEKEESGLPDTRVPSGQLATTTPGTRHGRLLHVYSGEGHNFDDWQELVGILEEMLSSSGQPSPGDTQPASWSDAGKVS
jgi:hypothetical protein